MTMKTNNLNLIKPFKKRWQFILFNLFAGCCSAIISLDQPFQSFSTFCIGVVWGTAIFISQWLGHAYIQTKISNKFKWLRNPVSRILLILSSVICYSSIAFLVVQSIMNLIVFGKLPNYGWLLDFKIWGIPILISFIVTLIITATDFFLNWKNALIEKEALKVKMLSYRYEALRNQVNPHFMFNSLNVLIHLVQNNQKQAVEFIHQFSQLYRYVLESREKELVPLEEEITFVKKYIYLLQTRFEDKLEVKLKLVEKNKAWIVPMAIQSLIENAVKHNQLSKVKPLKITIVQETDYISVSNPIISKTGFKNSTNTGLKNLKEQFAIFSENKMVVINEKNEFRVDLPLIKEITQ